MPNPVLTKFSLILLKTKPPTAPIPIHIPNPIAINNILDKSRGVVYFDFLHTSFIDSSGIGLVLGRYNHLKNENRKLVLANLSKTAYKVFELSGMFALMEYVEGVKE